MSSEDDRSERAGSVASSHTESGPHDEMNEKQAFLHDDESLRSPTLYQDSHHDGENDGEDTEMLPQVPEKRPEPPKSSTASGLVWIVINTLATVGIVSCLPPCAHVGRTSAE